MKQIVNFSKTRLLAETSYQFHLGIQARIKSETADKLEITEEAVVTTMVSRVWIEPLNVCRKACSHPK